GVMEQLVDRPALMANSTTFLFNTGSAPGSPRQTGQVWELGSEPKAVEQPQKILESVLSWTWTSRPMTGWNFMEISPEYVRLPLLGGHAGSPLQRRLFQMPVGGLLKGVGRTQDGLFIK